MYKERVEYKYASFKYIFIHNETVRHKTLKGIKKI